MKNFEGRVAMFHDDAKVLNEVASLGKTYVEIGTMFGASACIAGLAGCEVFCIDPLDGYYADKHGFKERPEPISGLVPSKKIVIDNWARCGLDPNKLHIFRQMHPPWPAELDRTFDVGMIDGDHRYTGVFVDYQEMSRRVNYLMFHDIDKLAVKSVFDTALSSGTWERYIPKSGENTILGVLKRR